MVEQDQPLVVEVLRSCGVDLVVSLPDSWLAPILLAVDDATDIEHLRVAREDDGVGVCAGAWLGGRRALLVCQNAGLLLSTNALAGLTHHHQIPLVALVADRGGIEDGFYYQAYKSRVTTPVLDAIGVPWHRVAEPEGLRLVAAAWTQAELHRRPVVVLATKTALTPGAASGAAR